MKFSRGNLPDTAGTVHDPSRTVLRAIKAGALDAVIVFSIGFILGTIRVLLLTPRLGETTAVIIEAPIMLGARWLVCRLCVDRLDVERTFLARSWMGLVAFLLLVSADQSACHLRIDGWSDRSRRSGGLRHVPGHSVWRWFGKPLDRQNTAAL
jgi:hypothetical protein